MRVSHLSAFFSCSFQDGDKELNDYFSSLCQALSINCKNVSDGYALTPPNAAEKLIDEAKVIIAVIPKREQKISGEWTMPSAIREEITMGFVKKKPTLMFIEEGVAKDGFFSGYATYIPFDRNKIYDNDFIKKAVSSIHELRVEASGVNDVLLGQDAAGYYAKSVSFLLEPDHKRDKITWSYSNMRRLVFTRQFEGQIKNSAWIEHLPEGVQEKIEHENICPDSSREDLKPIYQTLKDLPQELVIGIEFEGRPQKDDWVDLQFSYSSPYFNCSCKEDAVDDRRVLIDGKYYDCMDGFIPIQPTQDLHLQVRFPSWYKVDPNSIYPFVGSYSKGVDYVARSEMQRWDIKISKFGPSTQIDIRVENPLMRHVYGVAWDLL